MLGRNAAALNGFAVCQIRRPFFFSIKDRPLNSNIAAEQFGLFMVA
jgi:hypothetical protein